MKFRSIIIQIALGIHCLVPLAAGAQSFAVQAPLYPVPKTGFYRIPVTPALSAYARPDLSDIRIADEAGHQVPYIIRHEGEFLPEHAFIPFPILDNRTLDSVSIVELSNPIDTGIRSITLVMANHAVERYTALSGSDDRQHWYILKEQIPLVDAGEAGTDWYMQAIRFPRSKYRYFRLVIRNGHSDPLNISKAGMFQALPVKPVPYTPNPPAVVRQRDSGGTSYITVVQDAPYLTDRLVLQVSGPPYYRRDVAVFTDTTDLVRTGFTLSSAYPGMALVPPLKSRQWLLHIENGDNPPLRVISVRTEQVARYLVAWLEAGQQYRLLAADPRSRPPQYDLAAFNDSIPAALPVLQYGPLAKVGQVVTPPAKRTGVSWIWVVILVAVGALGFMTYRMVGELKAEKRA